MIKQDGKDNGRESQDKNRNTDEAHSSETSYVPAGENSFHYESNTGLEALLSAAGIKLPKGTSLALLAQTIGNQSMLEMLGCMEDREPVPDEPQKDDDVFDSFLSEDFENPMDEYQLVISEFLDSLKGTGSSDDDEEDSPVRKR